MGVALYIHIPFCLTRCHYCDFTSFTLGRSALEPDVYLQLLNAEMMMRGKELNTQELEVTTIYIGGGTPTALSYGQLKYLLQSCLAHFPLSRPEWTVEINPCTVTSAKLELMTSMGVNRISVGVQSLQDHELSLLGRSHGAKQAIRALNLCRQYVGSLSLDLMYGLPGQTKESFLLTLQEALREKPDHLSLYGLKVEDGTKLSGLVAEGVLQLPAEEEVLLMLKEGGRLAADAGLHRYEISNYARAGHHSKHNLVYWHNSPYLGVGLGAHSYWCGERTRNTAQEDTYTKLLSSDNLPVEEKVTVPRRQAMEDTMIMGLRLLSGVAYKTFFYRFGICLRTVFSKELKALSAQGLLVCGPETVRLTHRGLLLANNVFAEFVSVHAP